MIKIKKTKTGIPILVHFCYSAEREGFEPPEVLPSTVFKTAAFNRSAISPIAQTYCCFIYAGAKVQLFLLSANFLAIIFQIFFTYFHKPLYINNI